MLCSIDTTKQEVEMTIKRITHQIKQSYFVIYLPTHSNFKAKK